jgi:hypothetical protein
LFLFAELLIRRLSFSYIFLYINKERERKRERKKLKFRAIQFFFHLKKSFEYRVKESAGEELN